ncbi:response regulator transcription factor [Microvirga sp. BT688]|uniref:response regulator n=1 Tax=Microvirga sp. TaxID=1873136 RepID=UPI001689E4E6|nr:response regulator transcription factor [Microvirga sp.]MBD2748539.1 response regulator transcription factor [Microvirga sp.]
MQSQSTTIIIADDHPLFRGALRQSVASIMPHARVMEASGMDDLNATLSQERDVDLILLDLTMPGVQGFSGLMSLRAQYPELPVVIVSATEEPTVIRRAMDFGASGFIPKSIDIDSIGGAIQAVLAGDTWTPPDVDLSATEDAETADLVRRLGTLTPQQVRVLTMLSEGLLNKQIAYELGVSEATVKAHVSAILDKLGVDSRTQAVIAASKIGVTQRPSQAGAD